MRSWLDGHGFPRCEYWGATFVCLRRHRKTPQQAYDARLKARPVKPSIPVHFRVRRDKIDSAGVITRDTTASYATSGLGREHRGKRVLALIADLYIRVVDAENGELLRELTLDPTKDHPPLGRPPDPRNGPEMQRCPDTPANGVAGHRIGSGGRI